MRLFINHKAEILAITDTASPRRASIRSAVLPAIRDRYSVIRLSSGKEDIASNYSV